MARMTYTAEMMSIGEELSLSHARSLATLALAQLEDTAKFTNAMTGAAEHGPYANERLGIYRETSESIAKIFESLDERLGQALQREVERDKERERRAQEEKVDRGEETHANMLRLRALARGVMQLDMFCPVDEDHPIGEDGVCSACSAYAFDRFEPNQPTAVRYKPKPAPTPAISEEPPAELAASPNVVRIAKRRPHPFVAPNGEPSCGKPLDCGGTCWGTPNHPGPCMCIGDGVGEPGSCQG